MFECYKISQFGLRVYQKGGSSKVKKEPRVLTSRIIFGSKAPINRFFFKKVSFQTRIFLKTPLVRRKALALRLNYYFRFPFGNSFLHIIMNSFLRHGVKTRGLDVVDRLILFSKLLFKRGFVPFYYYLFFFYRAALYKHLYVRSGRQDFYPAVAQLFTQQTSSLMVLKKFVQRRGELLLFDRFFLEIFESIFFRDSANQLTFFNKFLADMKLNRMKIHLRKKKW